MKHDAAEQAAKEMALKEVDTFLFDQRISLAVVSFGARRVGFLCSANFCGGDVLSFPTGIGNNLGEGRKTPCAPL